MWYRLKRSVLLALVWCLCVSLSGLRTLYLSARRSLKRLG